MKEIEVVAALFERQKKGNQEVLIFQRADHVSSAGFWEFPGGKIERNETKEQALIREMKEELNIQIKVEEFLSSSVVQYRDRKINLHLFRVTTKNALHFDLMDHMDWAWVDENSIQKYRMIDSDKSLLAVVFKK